MKMKSQKSIVLKRNFKNLMSALLPIAKKVISNQINQIKSRIIHKIWPNQIKKRQNTPERVSNREINSLENNFSVKATINIITTPKIVIKKSSIVTSSKIATNPQKVSKPKIVDKPKIVVKKTPNYDEYKKRVIKQLKKQLKKLFDTEKSGYLDDDKEYKGIRDLEYVFEDVKENDEDYYKPERLNNAFKGNYRVYEGRGSQYYESLDEYLNEIRPYLENMIREYMSIGEWKSQSTINIKFISSRNPEQFSIRHS